MAKIFIDKNNQEIVILSRQEAVEILALLSGQLGGTAVPGNMVGAAPAINIQVCRQLKIKGV